jgi:hypothetical protein
MTSKNEFFGVSDNDPHFDADAAMATYNVIMKMSNNEAWAFSSMLLLDHYPNMLRFHGEELQQTIDATVSKKLEEFKISSARAIVSKSRNGEDIDGISKAVEVISKDFYDAWERSLNASKQQRGPGGQFRRYKTKINYVDSRPLTPKHAAAKNIAPANKNPDPKNKRKPVILKPEEESQRQQAYLQLQQTLSPFMNAGEAGVVELKREDGSSTLHDLESTLDEFNDSYKTTQRKNPVTSATLVINPDINVAGASYDMLGSPTPYNVAATIPAAVSREEGSFASKWNKREEDDKYNPTNLAYRRIGAASELSDTLATAAGVNTNPKVRLAIASGKFVGNSGQDVQSVIGPTADKAAYRYRGTEKTPEPRLQAIINTARQKEATIKGSPDRARNFVIYGTSNGAVDPSTDARDPGYRLGNKSYKESPMIDYFKGRLPSKELVQLQAKSGTITPSEGIIINRQGKVTTQAVGYGEDNYLPFNLANLKALRGGEYVRTRSMGGPTTEDVYAGLMTGARAATVVSNSGTFTIEFDPTFRGSRRYSDKAARMISRYGYLLDAVESGEVTLGDIDSARKKELRTEAEQYSNGDDKIAEDRYNKLLVKEKKNPTLSQFQKDKIAEDILNNTASKLKMADGGEASIEELLGNWVNTRAGSDSEKRDFLTRQVSNPEGAIRALNLQSEYDQATTQATIEYQKTLRPITLNGQGYAYALSALQEQFPYYITNISYRDLESGYDQGYVKPRFNRPANVLSGYFDTTIRGAGDEKNSKEKLTGKVSADKTRFQNIYGSEQKFGEGSKQTATVDELGNSISSQKSGDTVENLRSGSGSLKVNINPDPIEVLKAIEQIHANDIITTVNDGPVSLKRNGDWDPALKKRYPALYGTTLEDLSMAFEGNTSADIQLIDQLRKDVINIQENNQQISFGSVTGKLNISPDALRSASGQISLSPFNPNSSLSRRNILENKNAYYNLGPDLNPGGTSNEYRRVIQSDYSTLLDPSFDVLNDVSVNAQLATADAMLKTTVTNLGNAVDFRTRQQRNQLNPNEKPPMNTDVQQLNNDARRYAGLRQALRLFKEAQKRENRNIEPGLIDPKTTVTDMNEDDLFEYLAKN